MKTFTVISIAAGLLALPMASHAASDHSGHAMASMSAPGSAATASLADGVVKKIDKSAGRVTLAHGPLTNLNMPAMTMAFAVKNAGWLDTLKDGSKVRFIADRVDGTFTVVHLETVRQ